MYTGPHIIKDGLVFGYDTGYGIADNVTGTRFYPGEPVANMLNYGDNFNSWTKARNSGSYPTVDVKVKEGPFKNTLADRLSLPSDGSYPRIYQNFTPASTATHTFSVWLKGETPNQGCFIGAFRNSPWSSPSTATFSITNEWVNYSFNINPQDTSSMQLYIGSHNSHGGKSFLIYGAQLETGSTKSVFIDGTRLSTQSLIDLKETTDISMSNVSFDSTGQPEMDGSSDYIDLGADLAVSPINQGWTAEYVFNTDDSSVLQHFNGCDEDVHNAGWIALYQGYLQVWNRDPGTWKKGSTVFASNTWYHVAFVQESGTSMQFYVNGVAEGGDHTSYSWNASKSAFFARYIGRYAIASSYSRYFNGHIPVAKFYNKGLSAAEVKQNFNSYRKRFNL